jgi:exopolysaccharide biosynthesis polyprenyl glycosylphosphotransferase
MSGKKRRLLNTASVIVDVVLIVAAYLLALWLRMTVLANIEHSVEVTSVDTSALMVILSACVMVILYDVFGLYEEMQRGWWRQAACVAVANAVGLLFAGALLYALRLMDYSRMTLLLFYASSCILVWAKHSAWNIVSVRLYEKGYNRRKVLLIGSGELAERFFALSKDARYGCQYLGYCADTTNAALPQYRGKLEDIRGILTAGGVEEAVVALPQADNALMGQLISLCGRFGVSVRIIPYYNDFIPATPHVDPMGSLKLMTVRSESYRGPAWAICKRAMDLLISIVGIVVLSPLMLVTAILAKTTSPGPAIFSQKRAGKNGKPFSMYKFRSMCVDAESKLEQLQAKNEADGPAFKMAKDPRVTPFGRLIRKTSIDELPQLFNVLMGDMSIVGPRPPLLTEVAQYNDWDWGRLTVKPGLTCYWQISGRSELSFSEWMKLDLKYVEEQGFWTDCKIILRTVRIVFSGKGAY